MKICKSVRRFAAPACALSLFLVAGASHAQAEDQAAARTLFREGRDLMKNGKYAEACPKLEAASTLFQSAGILLNLGDCFEKLGKTASAWTEFGDAATVAERTNRDSEAAEAKQRQTAVETKLTRLAIRVAGSTPGLSIRRDGSILPSVIWAEAIPVDPGTHEINAEAPGRQPWSASVPVNAPGQTVTIDVPELAPLGAAPAPVVMGAAPLPAAAATPGPPPPPQQDAAPPAPGAGHSKAIDWALIGGGAAIAAGGTVLMIVESGRASQSRTDGDLAAYNSAKTPWTIGVVGLGVGGAAAIAGVILLTTTHHSADAPKTGLLPSPWVAAGGGGLDVSGVW